MKIAKLIIFISVFITLWYSQLIYSKTIKVPKDQPTIQLGINLAVSGDTVLVNPGVYLESINFLGKKIIVESMYVFSKDTTDISGTVIQGNNTASVVTFNNHEDPKTILTGFTITKGLVGIYCQNSSPTLTYLKIENNNNFYGFGGGMNCINSNPIILNTKILNNKARYSGGGLYCSNSNPKLSNVTISFNYSDIDGGGICSENYSQPKILNSVISNNKSWWYGGGIYCYKSNAILENVEISRNKTLSWYGGGLHCDSSSPRLTNVLITENNVAQSVGTGSGGGGIGITQYSNPYLSNVTITKNSAKVAGGGIYIDAYSTIRFDTLQRCNIYLNEAGVGFEIYSSGELVHLVVDTFVVMKPKYEHAFPAGKYSFDILHAVKSQDISLLYVSPKGNNANSGLSWAEPLRTIGFAKSIIYASYKTPATIYLDSGTYSLASSGEHFELQLFGYLSLKGCGVNNTILKGDNEAGILHYISAVGDTVENLTIMNGGFGLGGGIFCSESKVVIKNVIIRDCNSIEGGAIFASFGSNVTLINALLVNNFSSMWGGALCGYYAKYNLINVTISGNISSQLGSGIYCQSTQVNLINCILWNNLPDQVYCYGDDNRNSINVAYSNIENGRDGIKDNGNGFVWWKEETNMNKNPLFENAATKNFHITTNSPCIGAGIDSILINSEWFSSPHEDIEKNPRADSLHIMPDIGAYEYQFKKPNSTWDNKNEHVKQFALYQNYPNPFNPTTIINYSVPKQSNVTIIIYDALGREVTTLINEEKAAGNYTVEFSAKNLSSGIYFYQIRAGEFLQTKKMLLLR